MIGSLQLKKVVGFGKCLGGINLSIVGMGQTTTNLNSIGKADSS